MERLENGKIQHKTNKHTHIYNTGGKLLDGNIMWEKIQYEPGL